MQAAAFRLAVSSSLVPLHRSMPHTEGSVTLYRQQLQACVDSLRRAHSTAQSACQLCSKASRAFGEEAACIASCQDVLESYLQD